MKYRSRILLAFAVMSQTLAFGSQTSLAESPSNTLPRKLVVVAVCVESKTMILRWAPKNSCSKLNESKLTWSAKVSPPEICVDARTRVMVLADKKRCRKGSVKLAQLTPGRRAMACVNATTGALTRPRTGKCLVRNLAVQWMVVENNNSDARSLSTTLKRPTCGANCNYVLMVSFDLKNKNLSWVDFSFADFRGSNMSGANFTGTNFSGANLSYVDFTNAILTGTIFTGATLTGALFTGATTTTTTTAPATTTTTTTTTSISPSDGGGGDDGGGGGDAPPPATTPTVLSCAAGGTCVVGDTGPGGGIVFYVAAANFTSTDSDCGTACKYLEAATSDQSAGVVWATTAARCYLDNSSVGDQHCQTNSVYSGSTAVQAASRTAATDIGKGMANTNQIYARVTTASGVANTADYAAGIAFDYTNNGKTDWHLPSKDELNQIYVNRVAISGFSTTYWSSSENRAGGAWYQSFNTGGFQSGDNKDAIIPVRPVRAFAAGAPTATAAAMSTSPAGAASGVAFTTQPAVRITDASGNTVTSSGVVVTASVSGGATLVGTTTATASSGIATFSNLGVSGAAGTSYTLTFTPTGLTPVTASSGTVTFGTATKAMISTQPSGGVNGQAVTPNPVVRITDASGNTVTNSTVDVVATISSGHPTTGTTTVAAINGVATFTNLVLRQDGEFTLTFTPTSLTAVTSNSFTVTAFGAATKALMSTNPDGAASGSALTTQPMVRITDAAGTTVTNSTVNVVASIASGTGTLSGTTTVAAVDGVATFTNLVITATTGNFTLTFTPTALTAVTSSSFTVTAGLAAASAMTTQPAGAVSGVAFTTQPVVLITDASGNAVSSSTVSVVASIASGTGTLSGTTTVAAVDGVATFTNLVITGLTGSFALTFTPTGLNPITSNSFIVTDNCATGGTCVVGSTGLGGGTVFYVGSFTAAGTTCNTSCRYLEVAPSGWSVAFAPSASLCNAQSGSTSQDPTCAWSGDREISIATALQIGRGFSNTNAVITGNGTAGRAATASRAYQGGGKTDWFLPSKDELNELCKYAHYQTTTFSWESCASSLELRSDFQGFTYWSSSQAETNSTRAWVQNFHKSSQAGATEIKEKSDSYYFVRPVRAF